MPQIPQINPQTGQPVEVQTTPEDSFRETLDDVILIIEKMAPLSKDLDGLVGSLRLALTNDTQLNIVMHMVRPVGLKR